MEPKTRVGEFAVANGGRGSEFATCILSHLCRRCGRRRSEGSSGEFGCGSSHSDVEQASMQSMSVEELSGPPNTWV